MSAFPLLSTKINLPPGRSSLVQRPRLLKKLDLSLLPGNRLTILSAPAGFDKTTLVIDWQRSLVERDIPLAWFSIDEGDNDLIRSLRSDDPSRISEQISQAHLLIFQRNYVDAQTLLSGMHILAEQCDRFQNLIEIDILLGVTRLGLGNHDEALEHIEKAVHLAASEGSIRPFIDIDAFDLVSELRRRLKDGSKSQFSAFLDQILAFSQPESGSDDRLISRKPVTIHTDLVEPISSRELEVLQLMAKGLSNAEIARRLFLTVNTLKAHTNSIYGKLDVHSRMYASCYPCP